MATLQDLIDAVEALQSAVTNLTSEVNIRKANLDSAINLAETAQLGAEDAEAGAVVAQQGAESAQSQVIAELELVQRENNTVLFDKNYLIGNAGARTGNILYDFTSARLGTVTRMLHQDTNEFTLPSETKIVAGEYDGTVLNFIWFVYTKSGQVEVSITQEVI
jgi:hypothetical protein